MAYVSQPVAAAGMAISVLFSNEHSMTVVDDDDDHVAVVAINKKIPKVRGFVEEVISEYTDIDFKCHFRLRRSDVEVCVVS